ncbi:hypothetical protein [Paraflavitalea sp. CAU 1676]|uniref:hypothetical protein n=1 Tax=Paraflavitalea sp. CAU 1676 TaxID=3032598 RepID=UPI0023DBD1EB|nr:hypothetical protein [Paraflavitalea sp. CAU 1676]MDF2188449.1 hypothetical protein [Paraflavitalea sp. CAU 1676]
MSSSDCHYLHNDIASQMQLTISFNTLRRFFNLMDAKHEQSIYTLNTLSMYCGFASYDDFVTSLKHQPAEGNELNHNNSDLLNYLVMLFRKTEVSGPNDYTYNHLVRETILFLEHHPQLIDQFQREIARTKNGQEFYFEQFINVDNLNSFYGDGLRYYLHVKRTIHSQLFGNYLLCFRYWLTMDNKNLDRHYRIVMQQVVDKKAQPSWAGFYYASQLYHASVSGEETESILIKARQFYTTIPTAKEHLLSVVVFQFVMSQALVLIGQYEESLFYVGELLKYKKKYVTSWPDTSFLEAIYLFKAISMAHLGEKTVARELLEIINPTNFHFLSKQYMTILHLTLKLLLKKNASDQKQLQHLVQTTGFVRLLGE